MANSLVATIDQSKSIEGQIVLAVKTPNLRKCGWILVESSDDQEFYQKMFCGNVKVLPAIGPQGQPPNCHCVESIVGNVLRRGATPTILGIRDADNTPFLHQRIYYRPQNIVLTHRRDLEMLLLSEPICQNALIAWNPAFRQLLQTSVPYMRYMGYIRVWHDNYKHHLSLKKFSYSKIWNDTTRSIHPDWQQKLIDKYNLLTTSTLTPLDIEQYAVQRGLLDHDEYDICRGHDYLPFLSKQMIQTHIYSEKSIRDRMAIHYTPKLFWKSETGRRIKTILQPWKLQIIKR